MVPEPVIPMQYAQNGTVTMQLTHSVPVPAMQRATFVTVTRYPELFGTRTTEGEPET